jgi:hypothetical protein
VDPCLADTFVHDIASFSILLSTAFSNIVDDPRFPLSSLADSCFLLTAFFSLLLAISALLFAISLSLADFFFLPTAYRFYFLWVTPSPYPPISQSIF